MYMLLALERLAIYFETNYYGDVIQNLFVVPLDVNFYNKFSVTQPRLGFTGLWQFSIFSMGDKFILGLTLYVEQYLSNIDVL